MLIGTDFPKMEFDFFGVQLLELNGFIGNFLIFLLSLYYYAQIGRKFPQTHDTFINKWRSYYLVFGICFLWGGFGHLLFHYTGVMGKIPSWYLSMVSVYFIELACLSLYFNASRHRWWFGVASMKLCVFAVVETVFLLNIDVAHKPELGIIIPSICSIVGLIFCLGIIGWRNQKNIHDSFKYHWIAVIFLALSALIQLLKINLHHHFDRNDLSHLLLFITLILYYQTIRNRSSFRELHPQDDHALMR